MPKKKNPMIGCNVRSGVRPGGFAPKRIGVDSKSYLVVREAATKWLTDRSMVGKARDNDDFFRKP